jgi:L-arginine dehydrogenase
MQDLTKQDVLITSISTNVANAHEIAPSALSQMDVYCDYKATTPASAGEMKLASEQANWTSAEVKGDLADLVNQDVEKPSYQKPVFFRSIGLGLEDIAMAYGIWTQLESSQV